MDNKTFGDCSAPFMVRRQDTNECAVLLFNIGQHAYPVYDKLVSEVGILFSTRRSCNGEWINDVSRRITKLEVRWLPRRGYDSEGFPHTLLLNDKNMAAMLRLMLLRRGTDIIEATIEDEEDKRERGY